MLLANYRSLLEQGWQPVFAQPRSHQRALEHALAWPSVLGERTIAGSITVLGRDQQDWSADYKIYSRSPWSPQALFEPVVDDYLKRYPKGPVVGVIDDTGLPRTGKKVPGASWPARSLVAALSPQSALGAAVHPDGLAVSALPAGRPGRPQRAHPL